MDSQDMTLKDLRDRARQKVRGEYVSEFLNQLERVPYDDAKGFQGGPGSFQRLISVWLDDGGSNIQRLYDQWEMDYKFALAKEEKARLESATYSVAYWKGSKFGKPERIPREDLDVPWKSGFLLLDERGRIQGHNFDSDFGPRYTIKTLPIGLETDAGVVRHKRMVKTERGTVVQYLIKPWSSAGKRKYDAAKRLFGLERELRVNLDNMSTTVRDKILSEIEKLEKIVKRAGASYDYDRRG